MSANAPSQRQLRVGELIRHELAGIFARGETGDPLLERMGVTVLEVAVSPDLRIATADATVGLPELAVGIPSVLDAALLQQYVGLSLAKEMILTGELYPVERLTATGLCNEVVGHDDVDAAIDRLVARVAGHSPPAVAAQKRLFETWQNVGLRAGVEQSIGAFAEVFAHPETLDAVSRPGSRG
jgi:enoyl-CoA hydratase